MRITETNVPRHENDFTGVVVVHGVPVHGTLVVRYAKLVTKRNPARKGTAAIEVTPATHPTAYLTAFDGELKSCYHETDITSAEEACAPCLHASLDCLLSFALLCKC
jgi:hypothetical protein